MGSKLTSYAPATLASFYPHYRPSLASFYPLYSTLASSFPSFTPTLASFYPLYPQLLHFLSPKIVTFSDTILITIYSPPITPKSCIELPLLPPKMMLNFDGNWLRIPPTTPNLHLFWCKNSTRSLYSLLLVGPRHFIQPTFSLFSSDNLAVLRLPRIFNIQLLSKTT